MGATVDPVTLNASFWTLVATGPCNVTFEVSRHAHWVINNATTQPTPTRGNDAKRDVPNSLALLAGEYLFIKPAGIYAGHATVTVS